MKKKDGRKRLTSKKNWDIIDIEGNRARVEKWLIDCCVDPDKATKELLKSYKRRDENVDKFN